MDILDKTIRQLEDHHKVAQRLIDHIVNRGANAFAEPDSLQATLEQIAEHHVLVMLEMTILANGLRLIQAGKPIPQVQNQI